MRYSMIVYQSEYRISFIYSRTTFMHNLRRMRVYLYVLEAIFAEIML